MDNNVIQGKWKQISGTLKAKWGELTDDDLKQAEGNKEYLIGKLQEKYGLTKEKAADELKDIFG